MRFLLHPRSTPVSKCFNCQDVFKLSGGHYHRETRLAAPMEGNIITAFNHNHKSNSRSNIRTRNHQCDAVQQDVSSSSCLSSSSSSSSSASLSNLLQTKKSWGQQCSNHCGCVLRFEMTATRDCRDSSFDIVHQASYRANTILCTTTNTPTPINMKSSSLLSSSSIVPSESEAHYASHQHKRLVPILSRKGRPMMMDCHCTTLHHLAQATIDYITTVQPNVQKLRNLLLPSSESSSLSSSSSSSFSSSLRHIILHIQQQSTSHTHCYDLVHDALVALLLQRMIPPSSQFLLRTNHPTHGDHHRPQQQQQQHYPPSLGAKTQQNDDCCHTHSSKFISSSHHHQRQDSATSPLLSFPSPTRASHQSSSTNKANHFNTVPTAASQDNTLSFPDWTIVDDSDRMFMWPWNSPSFTSSSSSVLSLGSIPQQATASFFFPFRFSNLHHSSSASISSSSNSPTTAATDFYDLYMQDMYESSKANDSKGNSFIQDDYCYTINNEIKNNAKKTTDKKRKPSTSSTSNRHSTMKLVSLSISCSPSLLSSSLSSSSSALVLPSLLVEQDDWQSYVDNQSSSLSSLSLEERDWQSYVDEQSCNINRQSC
jgi:hypothetical protein